MFWMMAEGRVACQQALGKRDDANLPMKTKLNI